MKEELERVVSALCDARGEVEEVMHNCSYALAGSLKGNRRVEAYRQQITEIDAAIAAADFAMARLEPEPEPVAWLFFARKKPALRELSFCGELPIELIAKGFDKTPLYAAPPQSAQAALAQPEPTADDMRRLPDVDELAQHIRWLNVSSNMCAGGAGALAGRIIEWLRSRAERKG